MEKSFLRLDSEWELPLCVLRDVEMEFQAESFRVVRKFLERLELKREREGIRSEIE